MSDCPVCNLWDSEHAPGCVVADLQDLGRAGRLAHRRAQVLVVLQAYARPMTFEELGDATRIAWFDVGPIAEGLMAEGLVYPGFSPPTVCLTTAPHVPEACAQAADQLGLILAEPRRTVSPLLRR